MIESSYLEHYGIKGQKWGIRRYQNKDGTLTAAGKKQYLNDAKDETDFKAKKKSNLKRNIAIGAAVAATVIAVSGAVYMHKKKSYNMSIDMNSIKRGKYVVDNASKDTIIPKGSTIFRTSTNKNLRDSLTYASSTKADKDRYISRMSKMYKDKDLFQMKIKTLNDVKVPSEKKQFDMFVDLLAKDKDFSEKVTHNPYGKTMKVYGNKKLAEEFAKNHHYENFITKMIDLDKNDKTSVLSKFANHVKKSGYNGILDINDIGTTADKPIIVFDSKDNLTVDQVRRLNAGIRLVSGLKLKNVKI